MITARKYKGENFKQEEVKNPIDERLKELGLITEQEIKNLKRD